MNQLLGRDLIFALLVAFFTVATSISQSAEIAVKEITLDEFMQGNIRGNINIPIVVPTEFEPAVLPNANFGYSYWMKAGDVLTSNTSGKLPENNGYMYGKLTPNTAFDAQRNLFLGLEEPGSIEEAKKATKNFSIERYKFGEYPIALIYFSVENKHVYSMYAATNIGNNVVYIALRPPGGSKQIGDQIWKHLKSLLRKDQMGKE